MSGKTKSSGDGRGRLRGLAALLRHPHRLWAEHRKATIVVAAALVLFIAGVTVAYELLKRPADVHNASVPFKPQKPPKPKAKRVNWPIFGLNRERTRYLPTKGVKPPFKLIWHYTERPLLEFPPSTPTESSMR